MPKAIYLTGNNGAGLFTVVDDADYDWLRLRFWNADVSGYAVTATTVAEIRAGHPGRMGMHRLIMHAPSGFVVNHINGVKLDNRRCNLEIITLSENSSRKIYPSYYFTRSAHSVVSYHAFYQMLRAADEEFLTRILAGENAIRWPLRAAA